MKYSVILDQFVSVISPNEGNDGLTFEQAISHVIDYAKEGGYDLQEVFFEELLKSGESTFLSGEFPLSLA